MQFVQKKSRRSSPAVSARRLSVHHLRFKTRQSTLACRLSFETVDIETAKLTPNTYIYQNTIKSLTSNLAATAFSTIGNHHILTFGCCYSCYLNEAFIHCFFFFFLVMFMFQRHRALTLAFPVFWALLSEASWLECYLSERCGLSKLKQVNGVLC